MLILSVLNHNNHNNHTCAPFARAADQLGQIVCAQVNYTPICFFLQEVC